MSVSTLLFCVICFGAYKLGAYTERHPGDLWERARQLWGWMNK